MKNKKICMLAYAKKVQMPEDKTPKLCMFMLCFKNNTSRTDFIEKSLVDQRYDNGEPMTYHTHLEINSMKDYFKGRKLFRNHINTLNAECI